MKLLLGCLVAFSMILLFPFASAISDDRAHGSYETEYATIYYYQEDALTDSIDTISSNTLIVGQDGEKNLIVMKDNIDRMVSRVKGLLGIYPPNLHFKIHIYSTYNELMSLFREIGMTGDAPVAFYSHRYKTIYLSAEKLNDRVLAHEITHVVINSYFDTPPPVQIQEILAHYVERHLGDQ